MIKKSLKALAMSWGLVYVLFSYVMSEGDVLDWLLEGMVDLRILACSLGSSRYCFLARVMFFLSIFLYCLCALRFWGVGFSSVRLCSVCWRLICRLYFGLHQGFLRRVGLFSYFSIVVVMACWMFWSSCGVVWLGLAVWFSVMAA